MEALQKILFNKIEIYDIENTDSSFSNNIITLPSDLILESNDVLNFVKLAFYNGSKASIKYSADIVDLTTNLDASDFPISGSDSSNSLIRSNLSIIEPSYQPLEFNYIQSEASSINRDGSCQVKISATGVPSEGSISISGTTFERITLSGFAGNIFNGNIVDLKTLILNYINKSKIPESYFVSRVSMLKIGDTALDLNNYKLNNNIYDSKVSSKNESLSKYEIGIPNTSKNNLISYTAGSTIECTFDLSKDNDSESLFFYESEEKNF